MDILLAHILPRPNSELLVLYSDDRTNQPLCLIIRKPTQKMKMISRSLEHRLITYAGTEVSTVAAPKLLQQRFSHQKLFCEVNFDLMVDCKHGINLAIQNNWQGILQTDQMLKMILQIISEHQKGRLKGRFEGTCSSVSHSVPGLAGFW